MKTIGLIGYCGFLGQHVLNFFLSKKTYKILKFEGDVCNQKQVDRFAKKCDLVIHLAAENRKQSESKIIRTNIWGTLNVVDACYSHKKGFLTCVERNLTTDVFSVSKNLQKSIVSEFNKLGFQGLVIKLDPVQGSAEFSDLLKQDENKLLESLLPEDICKWIYSFSDGFLTHGTFYVKEFEFWDPIKMTVKELKERNV